MTLESNVYADTKLTSGELMTLHRYLFKMVADESMTTAEVEDILKRAGLKRRSEPNSWTDSSGAVYTLRENI